MGATLNIPGSLIGEEIPEPSASGLLDGVTAGPLLLIEPAWWEPVAGIPATGAVLPNLAEELAATTIGGAVGDVTVANGVGGASTKSRIQRTTKGGIHEINSHVGQGSPYELFDIISPIAIRDYLAANNTHDLYVSSWWAETRAGTGANAAHLWGVRLNFSGSLVTGRWATVGSLNSAGHATPGSAEARRLGANLQRSGAADSYKFFTAVGASESPSTPFNPISPVLRFGAGQAGDVNILPSRVFYRGYIEDLTVSGRTYAQVEAIDYAEYTTEVLTAGGRYYGDVWNDPATVLP